MSCFWCFFLIEYAKCGYTCCFFFFWKRVRWNVKTRTHLRALVIIYACNCKPQMGIIHFCHKTAAGWDNLGSLTYSPGYSRHLMSFWGMRKELQKNSQRSQPGLQWARSNYHIAQIHQLFTDQEYLHCTKKSEEGQIILTRHTSGFPLWVELLRCKKKKKCGERVEERK